MIPEFDMPAHSHAAIKAMEARHNKFKVTDAMKAETFRLIDPHDTSEYISFQWWTDNVMNPCIESTYRFVVKIVETLIELHKGIQPLKTFHFGGDEAPTGAWINSTQCKKFLADNPAYNSVEGMNIMWRLHLRTTFSKTEYTLIRLSQVCPTWHWRSMIDPYWKFIPP